MSEVEKHRKYLESARRRLEEAALKYARMKSLGRYIDVRGNDVMICNTDSNRRDHETLFANELLAEAVNLFAELSSAPLPERILQ